MTKTTRFLTLAAVVFSVVLPVVPAGAESCTWQATELSKASPDVPNHVGYAAVGS
jgi:hypothetical protein